MGPEIRGGPWKRLAECVHLVRSSWRLQQHSACVRQAQRFGRSATGSVCDWSSRLAADQRAHTDGWSKHGPVERYERPGGCDSAGRRGVSEGGASISSAVFLDDGRLALTMALPSQAGNAGNGMLDEAWIFDPARGSLVPFTTPSNPQAARVVVSPDSSHVAYAQPRQTDIQAGPATPRLADVMVAATDDARRVRVFTQCPEAWYLQRHGASRTRLASERLQDRILAHQYIGRRTDRLQRGERVGRRLLFAAIALLLVVGIQVSTGLAVRWCSNVAVLSLRPGR